LPNFDELPLYPLCKQGFKWAIRGDLIKTKRFVSTF
jgi:hypothetical protein